MSFAIITDTSANVPLDLVRAENIQVLAIECDMSGVEKKQSYLDDAEFDSKAFYDAMRAGANALAICTISDQLITGEALTVEERETSFTDMIELALETALKI